MSAQIFTWLRQKRRVLIRELVLVACALALGLGYSLWRSDTYLPSIDGNIYSMLALDDSLLMVLSQGNRNSLVRISHTGALLNYMDTIVYSYFSLMFLTESPIRLISPSAPEEPDPEAPALYEDEILAPDTDKRAVLITQVLSYGQPLPCVAQPETDFVSGRHAPGCREWFSAFALGTPLEDVSVRQSGPFIWRFTPSPQAERGQTVDEFRTEGAGLETMTVYQDQKDAPLWYQTAQWKEAP